MRRQPEHHTAGAVSTSKSANARRASPLCVKDHGLSLHAATRARATRRGDLEVLCRYILRPPIATDRIRWRKDGLVELSLGRRWSNGTTHIIFEPLAFIARLAPLIPAPGRNEVRYHGVLAPNAGWRAEVVAQAPAAGGLLPTDAHCQLHPRLSASGAKTRPRRLSWQELLKRAFAVDILTFSRCGGPRRVLALIRSTGAIDAILHHLHGLTPSNPRAPPAQMGLL